MFIKTNSMCSFKLLKYFLSLSLSRVVYSRSSSSFASSLFFVFFLASLVVALVVDPLAFVASSSLDETTLFTRLTTFCVLGEPLSLVGASTFREPNFSAKRFDSASESDDAFFDTDDVVLRGDFADTRRVPGATGCITREEEEEEEEEADGFLMRPLVVARRAPVGSVFFRSGADDAIEREGEEEGFSKPIPYGLNVVDDDDFESGALSSDMKMSAPRSLRDASSRAPAVNCFIVKPACS